MNLILLAISGALGAISRYLVGLYMMERFPNPPIPIAMLCVNTIGSFGLGFFFSFYFSQLPIGAYEDPYYLFIGIGFFGAFTTFSTYSVEAMQLYKQKKWKELVLYVSFSIFGSILFFLIGFTVFRF
ncbi:fluoride efflux transporter CrcB [Halalkalibacter hemicellulosilyticus]|uniref:Fluoride-specific ion channel FluC n=1 Tax=Halalkalibacter hemicellulosilyticusJCM 9152 TaxID=1236971 RepID=W4QG15_9BACI|nr:fluoride efflux transporter CrcB [Halalkalibacter hemicellulosilyticus]GAE30867.1 CrcB protein [Halalkalibacter hemicellulosilyticusJCM 9152]